MEILRLFTETHKGDPLPHPTMRACRVHSSREFVDAALPVQGAIRGDLITPFCFGAARSIKLTDTSGTDAWLFMTGLARSLLPLGANCRRS